MKKVDPQKNLHFYIQKYVMLIYTAVLNFTVIMESLITVLIVTMTNY